MNEEIYVFISHSHRDLEKVRKIRNFLESNCVEPILFFLKSKTDDDEIESLVKDEIDARIWFIHCSSKNSRESTWVKKEIEYVEKTGKQNCTTIDLDEDFDDQGELKESLKDTLKKYIRNFSYLQKLFVSCSRKDAIVVSNITSLLNKYGIETISDNDLFASEDWTIKLDSMIDMSRATLIFISEESAKSELFRHEISLALEKHKKIYPILLCEQLPKPVELLFSCYNCFKIDTFSSKTIEKGTLDLIYGLLKQTN